MEIFFLGIGILSVVIFVTHVIIIGSSLEEYETEVLLDMFDIKEREK